MTGADRRLVRLLNEDLARLRQNHREAVKLKRPTEEVGEAFAALRNGERVVKFLVSGTGKKGDYIGSVRARAEAAGFDLAAWLTGRQLRVNETQANTAERMSEEAERRRRKPAGEKL